MKLCHIHNVEMYKLKRGWRCRACAHDYYMGVRKPKLGGPRLCPQHGIPRSPRKPAGWFCYLCASERMALYRKSNPVYHMIMWAKIRAREKNVPFNIGKKDIIIPEFCPVLGIRLHPGTRSKKDNSATLDRVIPALGYVRGNVIVISHKANRIKGDATIEELERVLAYFKREVRQPVVLQGEDYGTEESVN